MKANELIERIQGTNNGYLFAPSGEDMETALRCPSCFKVSRGGAEPFPNRIALHPAPMTRSLETPVKMPDFWKNGAWQDGEWRIAGWDFIPVKEVKEIHVLTEYFEKFFPTEEAAREFHGAFLAGTHAR